MGTLRAGAAAVTITPAVGSYLQGYTRGKRSIGVHQELYAKALVFDDGATRAAIVTADLIGLEQATVAAVRAEVERWTGIPGGQVLVNCSHTHAGPTVCGLGGDRWGFCWGNPADLDYGRELPRRIAGAVELAARRLRPVALGYGEGRATFNVNRRRDTPSGTVLAPNPQGFNDQRVRVLKVLDEERWAAAGSDQPEPAPLAVLFSYTCHPTIMAMENLEVSGDYPGVAQAFVERALAADGIAPVALFAQGCCGNIRPNLTTPDGSAFRPGTKQDCERLGRVLGAEVVRVVAETAVAPGAGPIRAAAARVFLPYQRLPTREELEAIVARGGTVTHDGHRTTDGTLYSDAVWARYVLARLAEGELPTGIEAEVQALRIGAYRFVGLAGEAFGEIGAQIEERAPRPTLVLGYTNGDVGYLCTEESYRGGGYEPAFSWMLYHHPAPFEPTNERRLVEAGRAVLAEVG